MEITRDTVNQWLTEERRSQSWLAEKCSVTDQAVSNWLRPNNARPISASAQITIRALMEEDAAKKQAKPPHNLVLEFNDEQYAPIEKAALDAGETVREWAKRTLNEAAEIDIHEIASVIGMSKNIYELPFLGAVAAGQPVSAPLNETLVVPREYPPGHFVVEIDGRSGEPDFQDGERWVIDGRDCFTPKKGKPCIVSDGYGSYLKKWNKSRGVFESINPAFPDVQPLEEAKLQGYPVERI